MDPDAKHMRVKPILGTPTDWPNLKLAVTVTVSVCLALMAGKFVLDFPKSLFMTIGVVFVAWSGLFWSWNRKTKSSSHRQIAQLLLVWIFATALLLGVVYRVDRAGWLWFRLTGYNVTLAENLPADTSIVDFVEKHPSFAIDPEDPTKLILKRGTHDIDETVVVPPGSTLTIEPGVVLRFGVGRSLVSYSPIMARGTENEPIVFTARNTWLKWGAVGVVNAEESLFEHVRFEHGRQASVNDVEFLGGLSLIETDAEITHSQFVDLFGKDAVYVRHGRVVIRGNLFRDTYKDGLDLDAGAGEISHNQFVDCGDEGIDLSENYDVQVFDNRILDSRGGRISADNDLDRIKSLNTLGYSVND